jgi:nucleotide-binding universal stress UspA family protein
MAEMTHAPQRGGATSPEAKGAVGPVLFAYDGSELAALAIDQAGRQLAPGRAAIVVCVWQPADVSFEPVTNRHFDADDATQVLAAAEETAANGASLAERAGFRARGITVEFAPTWKGIVGAAEDNHASLIVMGSHRHPGLVGHLVGNVSAAVVAHAQTAVMLVHQRPEPTQGSGKL